MIAALAERSGGARFVELLSMLGASRDSLTTALRAVVAGGLVERNPGYGHPLRPEYRLTKPGAKVAGPCRVYARLAERHRVESLAYRKWTVPLLLALRDGVERFGALRDRLGDITPRALAQALKVLDGEGLVERRVDDGYPPRSAYASTRKGRALAGAADAILSISPRGTCGTRRPARRHGSRD